MSHILLPKSFISLVVTSSHPFAFIWNMSLMCIPVYNLESYEYSRRCRSLCHCYEICKGYIFSYETLQED